MKPSFKYFGLLLLSTVLIFGSGCGEASVTNAGSNSGDALKMRFAAFGDVQMGKLGINPSTANLAQLGQTVTDISNSVPRTQVAFMIGDMVVNEAPDHGEILTGQLTAWQTAYNNLAAKIPLLPVAGNHEFDYAALLAGQKVEAPNPDAMNAWVSWFVQEGYDFAAGNGPTPSGPNPDSLVRDESKLTYSFNRGDTHFVVINTDTLNKQTDPSTGLVLTGWIALNWIEQDVIKAQHDPAVSTIVLVGHKPIEMPPYTAEDGGILNTPQFPLADRLSQVMNASSKVKLFLACHCHSWDARRLNNGLGVWQVIVGNGGAPIEADWKPSGGVYFGYSIIDIYYSGKIVVSSYGRTPPTLPQQYYEDTPVPPAPATLRDSLVI